MKKVIIAVAAALSVSITAANATPITVKGTYSISEQYSPSQGGPTITDQLGSPFTENLTVGNETTATNFFTASPASSCFGAGCTGGSLGTETDNLTASFTFTSPSGTSPVTVSETATFTAKYSGTHLPCTNSPNGQTDCIVWSTSPLVVNFTDGAVLDVFLNNASDWAITPTIQFELVKAPSVPEPASLMLFGTALVGLGMIWRRRKHV